MARYIHRKFSLRSYTALEGVAPPLVAVASLTLVTSPWDFVVLEGLRTIEQQREYYESGASKTMDSKHLTGRAIDIGILDSRGRYINGDTPAEIQYYTEASEAFYAAARQLGVPLTWGGEWGWDFGHYQLPQDYTWRLQ